MTNSLHLPIDLNRRRIVFGSLVLLGAPALSGCDDRRAPPGQQGNLQPVGERVELRCYLFSIRNTDPKRSIVDVHIPFEVRPIAPSAPDGWGLDDAGPGVVFRTPPPRDPTETQPRPQPIPPGGSLGPFRFYLPEGSGDVRSGPVEFSFDQGPNGPLTAVEQNGKAVVVGPDGVQHIDRSGTGYCRELELTAPPNAAVHDVHLERLPGGNPTKFVGVDPPEGFASNPVEPNSITIFVSGGGPPIPAGGTIRFKVYYEQVNARFKWRFTDAMNNSIPGAEGTVSL